MLVWRGHLSLLRNNTGRRVGDGPKSLIGYGGRPGNWHRGRERPGSRFGIARTRGRSGPRQILVGRRPTGGRWSAVHLTARPLWSVAVAYVRIRHALLPTVEAHERMGFT